MDFQREVTALRTLALGAGALYLATRVFQAWFVRYKLRHIPGVSYSAPLLSYFGAVRFFNKAPEVIHEGYLKHKGHAFKIPLMTGWAVAVSGKDRVDELRRASDDVVSFDEAVIETIQAKHTLGREVAEEPYHIEMVRGLLTRNIAVRFPDVQDEIAAAFADHMPATEDWSSVNVLQAVMDITCRTSNRFFVDLPICRNRDYMKLNIDFTVDVVKAGIIIALFPEVLRPFVARLMRNVSNSINRALGHLEPMLKERLEMEAKFGSKWEGRPNDLISWLLESTQEEHHRTPRSLTTRILTINFAAIHTTSMTFTQVLFDLAMRPEYIPELRAEVEAIAQADGINKLSLLKMVKLDSFIKESQRIGGILGLSVQRITLKDFTFSDGLTIPKGTFVAVSNMEMQVDEENYEDPKTFDGFRFCKMAEKEDTYNKHSVVALSTDFLIFGAGRHACPGRFFAINEIKAFLAHLLINYDIQLDPNGKPLRNVWFNASAVPDPSATILVRKRQVESSRSD